MQIGSTGGFVKNNGVLYSGNWVFANPCVVLAPSPVVARLLRHQHQETLLIESKLVEECSRNKHPRTLLASRRNRTWPQKVLVPEEMSLKPK